MSEEIQALARRVQALEDIEAIRQLKHRYFRACDSQAPEAVRDCFVADGAVIDYQEIGRFESRDAFVAVYRELGCRPTQIDIHHGQNPEVRLTGPDTAEGTWDIYYFGINLEARTATQLAGRYADRYVREGGEWRIAETKFVRTSLVMTRVPADGTPVMEVLSR